MYARLLAAVMAMMLMTGGQAQAGAGQAAATTGEEASAARTVAAGNARSFDWHRLRAGAPAKSRDAALRRSVVLAGRSSWVCAPAGAGSAGRCHAR